MDLTNEMDRTLVVGGIMLCSEVCALLVRFTNSLACCCYVHNKRVGEPDLCIMRYIFLSWNVVLRGFSDRLVALHIQNYLFFAAFNGLDGFTSWWSMTGTWSQYPSPTPQNPNLQQTSQSKYRMLVVKFEFWATASCLEMILTQRNT